jgi:hypothetical protein
MPPMTAEEYAEVPLFLTCFSREDEARPREHSPCDYCRYVSLPSPAAPAAPPSPCFYPASPEPARRVELVGKVPVVEMKRSPRMSTRGARLPRPRIDPDQIPKKLRDSLSAYYTPTSARRRPQ